MCQNKAEYRYTWPGKDESLICDDHGRLLKGVANALGVYLQVIPLSEEDNGMKLVCMQEE